MYALQPHGRVRTPDSEIEIGEPLVRIGVADHGYEQGHFLVTGSNEGKRVPVPEYPRRRIGSLHLVDDKGTAGQVGGKQREGSRKGAPPSKNQHERAGKIGEDDLIDCSDPRVLFVHAGTGWAGG